MLIEATENEEVCRYKAFEVKSSVYLKEGEVADSEKRIGTLLRLAADWIEKSSGEIGFIDGLAIEYQTISEDNIITPGEPIFITRLKIYYLEP